MAQSIRPSIFRTCSDMENTVALLDDAIPAEKMSYIGYSLILATETRPPLTFGRDTREICIQIGCDDVCCFEFLYY